MSSCDNRDCWNLYWPTCDDSFPQCCLAVQHQIRYWMVWSNLVYLVPTIVINIIRGGPRKLSISDWYFCLSFLMVAVSSSFYHNCDDADGLNPCYANCYNVGFNSFYRADVLCSLFSIHGTASIRWEITQKSSKFEVLYTRMVPMLIAVFSIWFINYDYMALTVGVSVGVLDLVYRLYLKKLRFLPNRKLVWSSLIAAGGFLAIAILAEFTDKIKTIYGNSMPVTQVHSLWHTSTMAAAICFAVVIAMNTEDKSIQHKGINPITTDFMPLLSTDPDDNSMLFALQQQQQQRINLNFKNPF